MDMRVTPQARLLDVRSRRLEPFRSLTASILSLLIRLGERRAERALRRNRRLWALLQAAAQGNPVTGVSYSDYLTLYDEVRRHRPREILECGTGLSTIVLAQALCENEADGHARGRITSMEDNAFWLDNAKARFPEELLPYVEFVLSPKQDAIFKCFRGVAYSGVPERPYDFVFSDGPDRRSPVNGDKVFNVDLINVILRSSRPVRAIVDDHFLTCYVLQKVLGPKNARYSARRKLLFVGPVTSDDVGYLERENFLADLRLFGTTEFKLRMTRPAARDKEMRPSG